MSYNTGVATMGITTMVLQQSELQRWCCNNQSYNHSVAKMGVTKLVV
jgi:hypothetical protein